MSGSVSFVLCVDTEGPLYESPEACIERVNRLFGLDLVPGAETLAALQNGEMDLGEHTEAVAKVVSPDIRDWHGNWKDVEANVDFGRTPEYRNQVVDDEGRGLVFNWFICDWKDFPDNPRRKPMGLNQVFEHYWSLFKDTQDTDPLYFHHHARPFSGASHHPCHNWSNVPDHITKLSANLLEFGHWPACVRTPIMAPDIHLFLEQWFPFDLSNTAVDTGDQPDVSNRRWTDWEGAPSDWSLYHPALHDYRRAGDLGRAIGRSVQMGSRYGNLEHHELVGAFERAQGGEHVLVSAHTHDHSPCQKLSAYYDMINRVRKDFPGVTYHNATAVDAFRRVLGRDAGKAPTFTLSQDGAAITCRSDGPIWGAQPWFCFRTRDGQYRWDNTDMLDDRTWRYFLDDYTYPLDLVDRVAFAASDAAGNTAVAVGRVDNGVLGAPEFRSVA